MGLGIGQWYDLTELPQGYTLEQVIDLAKSKGASFVRLYARYGRLPIDWNVLEATLDMLKAKNMKVLFCPFMNWKDHLGYFGSPDWKAKWLEIANRYKNDSRIWMFELFNEPQPNTWYTGISVPQDVQTTCAECIDIIRSTGDTHPILLPDHMIYNNYSWTVRGGTQRPNTVQGVHLWCSKWAQDTYITGEAFFEQYFLARWTKWHTTNPDMPTLVGEVGIEGQIGINFGTLDFQAAGETAMINWCIANNVDFSWHLFGWNYQPSYDFYSGKFDWLMPQTNWKLEPVPPPQQAGFPIAGVVVLGVVLAAWWLLTRKKKR